MYITSIRGFNADADIIKDLKVATGLKKARRFGFIKDEIKGYYLSDSLNLTYRTSINKTVSRLLSYILDSSKLKQLYNGEYISYKDSLLKRYVDLLPVVHLGFYYESGDISVDCIIGNQGELQGNTILFGMAGNISGDNIMLFRPFTQYMLACKNIVNSYRITISDSTYMELMYTLSRELFEILKDATSVYQDIVLSNVYVFPNSHQSDQGIGFSSMNADDSMGYAYFVFNECEGIV